MTKITVDKEFRSLWASKLPLRQIAERYGVNPSWVSRVAHQAGLVPRAVFPDRSAKRKPPPTDTRPYLTMTAEQKADYITYRQAGYSIEEAATKATAAKVKIRATPKVMA